MDMGNKPPVVIGMGEILWDLFNEGKQLGGAPASFAHHARQLGADAYVVSRVGDDLPGREILPVITLDLCTDEIK